MGQPTSSTAPSARRPGIRATPPEDPYPVVFRRNPAPLADVVVAARAYAAEGVRFAMFETSIGGVGYQALAHLMYEGEADARLSSIVGYTVNLPWVRTHYFSDFISQIQSIIGDPTLEHRHRRQRRAGRRGRWATDRRLAAPYPIVSLHLCRSGSPVGALAALPAAAVDRAGRRRQRSQPRRRQPRRRAHAGAPWPRCPRQRSSASGSPFTPPVRQPISRRSSPSSSQRSATR